MEDKSVNKEVCEEKHKAIEQYLKNDKEAIAKLIQVQTDLALTQSRITEQMSTFGIMFQKYDADSQFYRDTITRLVTSNAKSDFWNTHNGKLLFKTILIIGGAIIVATLGLNISEMLKLI